MEARPDIYWRYSYRRTWDYQRAAIEKYLHAEPSTCVFVPNATTGINTVLRNLVYEKADVIIYFSTIYGACEKTVSYITETTPAVSRKISYTYPCSDASLLTAFEEMIKDVKSQGLNPKIAIFDTIVSLPGVRMPFESLTSLCRKHGILSCIDGAHGVGHIPLNLSTLDPDFFVSNAHKWLYVPRGCAVFYVPERNQHLIRSALPTSHGFLPRPDPNAERINNPLPPSEASEFLTLFRDVGTVDNSPYTCITAALEWRDRIVWSEKGLRGEEAIFAYCMEQAREAGKLIAGVLGTDVLENEEGTLTRCNFSNVRLPLDLASMADGNTEKAIKIGQWIAETIAMEYNTFIAIILHADSWWVRLSGQVYLTMADWQYGADVLKEVCKRVKKGEWKEKEKS